VPTFTPVPTPAVASCLNNPAGCTDSLSCGNQEKCECNEECLSDSCDITDRVCKFPPDLWIWAFVPTSFFPSAGENLLLTVSVVNANVGIDASGFSTAPNSMVRFYEGFQPKCNDPGWFAQEPIKSLIPFTIDTKLVVVPAGTFAPGTYTIWALANGACNFTESSETNNALPIFINVM
jgi:hypothetical protein